MKGIKMFISTAFAQTAEALPQTAAAPSSGFFIIQMILLFAVLWFVVIRPQQKRLKKHEAELRAIIKGTKVIVAGLLGKVVAVKNEEELLVEFADGVQIPVMRAYVSQVLFDTPTDTVKKKGK